MTVAGALGKIYNDSVYYWERPIVARKHIFSATRLRNQDLVFYLNDSSFLLMDAKGGRKIISHKNTFGHVLSLFHYNTKFIIESDKGYYSLNTMKGSFEREPFNFDKHVVAYDSVNKFFWTFTNGTLAHGKETDAETTLVLKDVMVTQLHFDKEGNTWIGTHGKGLFKYATQDFDLFSSEKLGTVMAIHKDKGGTTWIGSAEKGLWNIKQGVTKHYPFEVNEHGVTDIKTSVTGDLWIASGNGLGKYDSKRDQFRFYNREDGLTSKYVLNIDFDERGGLWCGTSGGGVNYFDGTQFTSFTSDQGLQGQVVYAIRYFKNNKTLFVGTEFGLSTLTENKVRKVEVPELTNTSVLSINLFRDSLLLIGSSGAGVLVFDPAINAVKKLFATKDGLPSNLVYFVAADQDDYIWIGTEQGINRIRLNESLDLVENLHYGFENGLKGVEANQNAFYFGAEKIFGLIDGIYQFTDHKNVPETSHDLHLTSVELYYGEFSSLNFSDSTTGFFKVPYRPVFPSTKNHLTFHFNRVSKRNPQSVRYKYFLKNFDMAWSQPTALGQVTYGNLPPGNYTLHVLATNNQGSWDHEPLQYSFTIEAPFYATRAFIGIVSVLVLGLVLLILSVRERRRTKRVLEIEHIRQQEQAHLRKEIARDFHDEMGNQLTRIINYVSVMKLSKNGEAVDLFNKVEDSAKYLYTGTRDFIWSIDPQNDELSRLFLHIRDFGEKLFEEKGIQFRAYNEIKDPIRAPYGFSREANLIMKEAMTNVFNHSRAKNVAFILKQSHDQFEMILQDDGIGFSISELTHLNGIKNMRIRAERIKSVLRIANNTNQSGTLVSLSFTILKSKKYANRI